jgi:hypothetical protein
VPAPAVGPPIGIADMPFEDPPIFVAGAPQKQYSLFGLTKNKY